MQFVRFVVERFRVVARRNFASLCLLTFLVGAVSDGAFAQSSEIPLWTGFQIDGQVAYLLRKSPSQLMRYDLASEQWLTPLAFDEIPTAFAVGEGNIFVAFDRKIERFDLQGANGVHVANTPDAVSGLFIDGGILLANRSNSLYALLSSYNIGSGTLIDTHEGYPHSLSGAAISSVNNRIYGRTSGISPADIDYVEYDDNGNFLGQHDSPYHGNYPGAGKVWTWNDGSKVVDDSGTIYLGADLTYAGTLPVEIADVAFHGIDVPIVLSGSEVVAYNQALLETGRASLTLAGRSLTVFGEKVFVFNEDGSSPTRVGVEKLALTSLSPVPPGTPISPVGLAYEVTSSAIDGRGVIYLLSKAHSSIFRWDVITQTYLSTIPLPQTGDEIVFSPAHDALFLLGSNRTVYKVSLAASEPVVTPHVATPNNADFMLPLGSDLLVAQNGGWDDQWVYDANGTLLESSFMCCYDRFHFYDEPRSRLFVGSTFVTYLGGGQFSEQASNAYFGDYSPIRLSPDGQRIVSADGTMYQASPLQAIDYLSNNIVDAQWLGDGELFSIKSQELDSGWTVVQRWSPYLTVLREESLLGEHVALLKADAWLVAITTAAGRPRFHVLDQSVDTVPPPTLAAPDAAVENATALAVGIRWDDVQGEAAYQVERRIATTGDWVRIGSAGKDEQAYLDVDLHSGKHWEYRVRAVNGNSASEWSNLVDVDLSGVTAPVAIDPRTVQFSIDDAFIGRDDRVYVLSKQHKTIFVWDSKRQRFESSIGLRDEPQYVAYSASRHVIYTAYADRSIYSLSPDAFIPYEYPLTSTTAEICGLVAAGDILVACDFSGAWESTHTYDVLGRRIDYRDWRYPLAGGVWSEMRQGIYHFRDGSFPNDLIFTPIDSDGNVGTDVDSPYHTSDGIRYPIRVHPDGSVVVLGSGYVFNASTLEYVSTLPGAIKDATWINGRFITLDAAEIAARDSHLSEPQQEVAFDGEGKRVFTTSDSRLVLAVERDGTTELEMYTEQLERVRAPLFSDGFER